MKLLALLTTSALLLASEDMLNLLDDLKSASEISTKTKLNINKTPAVVSILESDELQKLGFTSVYEALESVPGIDISMGIGGGKQINMRGNKSIVTDKLKFMVDGISINAELSGANHFYLNMPIENIERIEIIRGPASALYGSFAHIGLINVITKASTHKRGTLFVRGSSKGSKNIGFTQHFNSENIKLALSGSFEANDNSREYENYSLLPNHGPFTSYENFKEKSLNLNLELYKDISLVSKYLELEIQNHFGYGTWPIMQDPKSLLHASWVNELRYAPKITNEVTLDLKLGYKEYGMSGDSRVIPYSTLQPKPPYPPYDLIAGGVYKERTLYTDLALNYKDDVHAVTFGAYLGHSSVRNPTYYTNIVTLSEEMLNSIEGGGIKDKIDREHYAFYFSDVIALSSRWMANVGLRYDDYSDVDTAFSPKLSLLYMADEHQSYKLMYQNSFRAPTFVELHGTQAPFIGDENLDSETIDTLEFAYSYTRGFNTWLSLNFFYSQMQNFIYRDTDFTLKNGADASSYGGEFEFKTPLCSVATLQANYSYVSSKDSQGVATPFIANHLANAMLSYQISKDWHTGTRLRYVGERKREELDRRDALSAYATFDQTLTYKRKNFLIQGSIKNIFNQNIAYPAPLGNETSSGTYLNDLERDGRIFWLSAQWKFE